MREQAFSDFQETVRQSSAFNCYIKDKIMSKDQLAESHRSIQSKNRNVTNRNSTLL